MPLLEASEIKREFKGHASWRKHMHALVANEQLLKHYYDL